MGIRPWGSVCEYKTMVSIIPWGSVCVSDRVGGVSIRPWWSVCEYQTMGECM